MTYTALRELRPGLGQIIALYDNLRVKMGRRQIYQARTALIEESPSPFDLKADLSLGDRVALIYTRLTSPAFERNRISGEIATLRDRIISMNNSLNGEVPILENSVFNQSVPLLKSTKSYAPGLLSPDAFGNGFSRPEYVFDLYCGNFKGYTDLLDNLKRASLDNDNLRVNIETKTREEDRKEIEDVRKDVQVTLKGEILTLSYFHTPDGYVRVWAPDHEAAVRFLALLADLGDRPDYTPGLVITI